MSRSRAKHWQRQDDRLFTLVVTLIGGPVTKKFVKENPECSRTIAMRGDQTLAELHGAIFWAFDREEEHLMQFEVGGKEPGDRNAQRYTMTEYEQGMFGDKLARDVEDTAIGSIHLRAGHVFFYWFDFGDDWWHAIKVESIEAQAPPGEYPMVTARVGKSPPQYPQSGE
jgi:hypothetical protein